MRLTNCASMPGVGTPATWLGRRRAGAGVGMRQRRAGASQDGDHDRATVATASSGAHAERRGDIAVMIGTNRARP